MTHNKLRSSDILLNISQCTHDKEYFTYNELVALLGDRAFGIVMLFFALPSALPFSSIPGVSFVFSIPIVLCTIQIILARTRFWLPQMIGKKTVMRKTINKVITTALPYLKKLEHWLKPRYLFMTSRFMEVINGLLILILAICLMLPIPFSNFIFSGLIIVVSLGIIERDGLFIALGYILTAIYFHFMYLLIMTAIKQFL